MLYKVNKTVPDQLNNFYGWSNGWIDFIYLFFQFFMETTDLNYV